MHFGASAASVPAVTGVTSPLANNLYSASQSLSIQVIFSEAVVVAGDPQLELETGVNDGLAYFTSGSGSNTLVFTYTVSPDHTSLDLDYKGIGSLLLNGGSIKSLAGVAASVALAPPGSPSSLGANRNLVIDTIPSVLITSNRDPGPTSNASIVLTFNFSEAVTDFDAGDVTVSNATKGLFSVVSANLFTLELTATGSSVSASLPANAVLDASGNQNAPSATWSIIYDNQAPTVTISSNRDPGPTNQSEMTLTITFSKPVNGFSTDDIVVNNAQKGTFTATSASVYSLNVSATGASVSASVPALAASDAAGNSNIASIPWSIAFDSVAPMVAITSNRLPDKDLFFKVSLQNTGMISDDGFRFANIRRRTNKNGWHSAPGFAS
jgi:hypothetical protein